MLTPEEIPKRKPHHLFISGSDTFKSMTSGDKPAQRDFGEYKR